MTMRARSGAVVAALLVSCALAFAGQDRAQDILARARQAIGGRLDAVKSLSVNGSITHIGLSWYISPTSARRLDDRGRVDDFSVEILLPDKYLLTTSPSLSTSQSQKLDGVNGERLIAASLSVGQTRPDSISPSLIAGITAARQRDLVRDWLAWLLTAPESSGVKFSDGGSKMTGNEQLDCVEARGAHDLALGLFFDAQSRLVMIAYQEPSLAPLRPPAAKPALPEPKPASPESKPPGSGLFTSIAPPPSSAPPPTGKPAQPQASGGEQHLFTSIEAGGGGGATVIRLSDYRTDDGIVFPHRMTIELGGQLYQQWEIKRFKVNPSISPKHFQPTVIDAR